MDKKDWLPARIRVLEERLLELRAEWENADLEKREKITIEGLNKKTELYILQKVLKNRKEF